MIHKITINNVVYLYKDIDEVINAIQKAKEEKEHAGKENIHLHHNLGSGFTEDGKIVWNLAFEPYQNGRV